MFAGLTERFIETIRGDWITDAEKEWHHLCHIDDGNAMKNIFIIICPAWEKC